MGRAKFGVSEVSQDHRTEKHRISLVLFNYGQSLWTLTTHPTPLLGNKSPFLDTYDSHG